MRSCCSTNSWQRAWADIRCKHLQPHKHIAAKLIRFAESRLRMGLQKGHERLNDYHHKPASCTHSTTIPCLKGKRKTTLMSSQSSKLIGMCHTHAHGQEQTHTSARQELLPRPDARAHNARQALRNSNITYSHLLLRRKGLEPIPDPKQCKYTHHGAYVL